MSNVIHQTSETVFYVLGAVTLLAHLVGFVKNWLKIHEMRQKRRDKLAKAKTPHEKMQRRLGKARRDALLYKPRKVRN
ncbi:hypothetical protein pEaSNUABM13_00312 [Erwinia phage pEa_SNUABM_13]|nr:hypothetical protein pEaSNUABM13_00312 [Erwinia phage pEa_SNUABM_13]QYW03612.1 hypothetical protein pEaSNUABM34_00310 [Erwinia phage pEa_SNUABM_34]QYW05325.1 hypothetical protein pEaSNUABM21_00311 [Erwinia phage pEa_SNUABM_21]QYW05665.1 hypothetical protein pEaSNUABM25_00309 [Erwinia phage pEa_SNUABM_25]